MIAFMSDSITESMLLFERLRAGHSDAADWLFRRYVRRLCALVRGRMSPKLVRRFDAEDVVQSAYRSFFIHAQEGDFVIKGGGDLWRLLAAITLNKLSKQIERHSAGKRDVRTEEHLSGSSQTADLFYGGPGAPSPEEDAMLQDELDWLTKDLDLEHCEILSMRLAGYRIAEIAEEVHRSERTVRRLLSKLKEQLQTRLDTFVQG